MWLPSVFIMQFFFVFPLYWTQGLELGAVFVYSAEENRWTNEQSPVIKTKVLLFNTILIGMFDDLNDYFYRSGTIPVGYCLSTEAIEQIFISMATGSQCLAIGCCGRFPDFPWLSSLELVEPVMSKGMWMVKLKIGEARKHGLAWHSKPPAL